MSGLDAAPTGPRPGSGPARTGPTGVDDLCFRARGAGDDPAEAVHRTAGVDDLCFRARALAQTHPMTEASYRYRQHRFELERARQPVTELADWASTALMVGYCLRRAEEQAAGLDPVVPSELGGGATAQIEAEAAAVCEALRSGEPDSATLLPGRTAVTALNRIIATELDKRREHLRENLDDAAWGELEDYVAWWVLHGYGVRAAEAGPK